MPTQPPSWQDALTAALNLRADLIRNEQLTAYRLITGHAEKLPGIVAERYGSVIILQWHEGADCPTPKVLRWIAEWYADRFNADAVYLKQFQKDRSSRVVADDDPMVSPSPYWGRPVDPEISVLENGLTFIIKPYVGYSVGLFLDQRNNRAEIRSLASGRRVLNAFAYTCGFSVAAAVGGAREIVSVDISPKALEWGKRNFQANGLDPAVAEFYVADTLDFLRRTAKRNRRYDLIIIDPPTFARRRKSRNVFNIRKDLIPLIRSAADVLDTEGVLLVSTNLRSASVSWLRNQIATAVPDRSFRCLDSPPLPIDFATDENHSKSVFVQFA